MRRMSAPGGRWFEVRAARADDAGAAEGLFLEPPGGLNAMITDVAARRRIARAAFSARGTGFSFERTLVAESDGQVVGLVARVLGTSWPQTRVRTGMVMLRAAGIRWGPSLVRLGRLEERDMQPVGEDVLYVVSLAVEPEWRSRRIGRALLRRVQDEATRMGLRAVALDVAAGNREAIRFYVREGFAKVKGEVARAESSGLIRMERPVVS